MPSIARPAWTAGLLMTLTLGGLSPAVEAQDVELWGRLHGTRPPQAYYDLKARDPGAFEFQRALFRRGLRVGELPPVTAGGQALLAARAEAFARLRAPGEEKAAVSGAFHFPLILGLFFDSPPPEAGFLQADVQAEFFDGPQAHPQATGTIPDFYSEVSGGRITLSGTTFDWVSVGVTQEDVAAGESGLGSSSRVGEFIVRILQALDDGTVDWGQFDNDGPDGVPNSGDDDGYVDVLAVMHPTPGGECSAPSNVRAGRIWSHRWNLYWSARFTGSAWAPGMADPIVSNVGYVTQTPSAAAGFPYIRVLDYTIQPVRSCSGELINTIGVFAHELGHGFGLPDLYVTSSSQQHEGIGNWGLMGTGAWGCDGHSSWRPCHLSAWSKEALGWADLEVLPQGADLGILTLPPVETTGKIFRMDSGDGSPEYLLLENRERIGFDQELLEPGLLVWQIDPVVIANPPGGINNDPERMGVWLRQADGLNELALPNGGRGDDGDPFPGATGNTAFHAGSNPSSWSHEGKPMGITLLDITRLGQDVTFRALTRFQTLLVRTEGSPSGQGLVRVDGTLAPSAEWPVSSAPFQTHSLEAEPGEVVDEGVRVAFQNWSDGAPRIRTFTTGLEDATLTARYGGRELLVTVEVVEPVPGIVPGTIEFQGGDESGWVPEGQAVTVTAVPRTGFDFSAWAGDLAGQPNPATVTVVEPVSAQALFEVIFSTAPNPPTVTVEGATTQVLTLLVENANLPVLWTLVSGTLPEMMSLDPAGAIKGVALQRGTFPLLLHVRDAIGLEEDLALTLVVEDPPIPISRLASAFLQVGPSLDPNERIYLDREGNRNGTYDLGDFRAFVLRNPDLPLSGEARAPVVRRTLLLGSWGGIEPGAGRTEPGVPGSLKREEGP